MDANGISDLTEDEAISHLISTPMFPIAEYNVMMTV